MKLETNEQPVKRNKTIAIVMCLVVVSLIIGIVVLLNLWQMAETSRVKAQSKVLLAEKEAVEQERIFEERRMLSKKRRIVVEREQRAAVDERRVKVERERSASSIRMAMLESKLGDVRRANITLQSVPDNYRNWAWGWVHASNNTSLLDFSAHNVCGVARFSPDGTRIITAGRDPAVKIWDSRTGEKLMTLKGHRVTRSLSVSIAEFPPNGKLVVTVDAASAKIWNAITGKKKRSIKHQGGVLAATFSPDSEKIVVRTLKSISIWNVPRQRGQM